MRSSGKRGSWRQENERRQTRRLPVSCTSGRGHAEVPSAADIAATILKCGSVKCAGVDGSGGPDSRSQSPAVAAVFTVSTNGCRMHHDR